MLEYAKLRAEIAKWAWDNYFAAFDSDEEVKVMSAEGNVAGFISRILFFVIHQFGKTNADNNKLNMPNSAHRSAFT